MKISIVAPVYNEEDCLAQFYDKTRSVVDGLKTVTEWVFVNDGSTDRSAEILANLCRRDPRVKVITFSRNFGHQPAIKAGIDHAMGDAVITMDTDLQDPPEAISEMIAKWKEGYDVVYAVRVERKGESFLKKITAAIYYRLMKRLTHIDMPLDAGDFRLMARPVVDELKKIREKKPYLRGIISWLGFRQTGVPIKREARFAGKTKYSLSKMLQFAWSGITHFSFFPLQLATWIGFLTFFFCFAELIHTLYVALVLKIAVPGWASLMVAILFLGSVQLITLGILGSYVARNYDESRNRPLYVIQKKRRPLILPLMPQNDISLVQREKEFHNQLAKTINFNELLVRETFESPTAIENRFVLQAMGDLKGKKILDLGCGAGETAVYFALQGADVCACDIAEDLLTVAARLAEKFNVTPKFSMAAAGNLPYPDDGFDYVFGNGLLHHVELSSAAPEIRRVLKQGGKAFFIEPLPYNPAIHVYRAMATKVRSADEKPLSFKQLKKFASVFASWRHQEFWLLSLVIFFHFFFIRGWHPSKVRYWKRVIEIGEEYKTFFLKLQRADNFLLKHLPFLRYLCWNTVLVVEK